MSTTFTEALKDVLAFTPEAFAALGTHLRPEWFFEALAAHQNPEAQAAMRRRKLPLDRALWLTIGMGLFRDRSIHEVVEHLELAIPKPGPRGGVAPSAVPQARSRLGAEPAKYLFELTAERWGLRAAEADRWQGLSLYGLDGSCLRVADTPENSSEFGRPGSGRAGSGYPQIRFVGLMALRSHVLAGMSVGGFKTGEMTLVEPLWEKIPDQSLTVVDRGFLSWWPLYRLHTTGTGRHFLIRAKSNLKWKKVRKLGVGDELVDIEVNRNLRRKHPEMPETFQARVISYQMKGYRAQKLITSMLDVEKFPAKEIAALYHERWELELGYDEIKTHMLEREEALRSRTPEGVLQEVAGIGVAYNLVRVEMARIADELDIAPTSISFRHALMLIRNFCLAAWATSPGAVPRRLGSLDQDLRLLLLPPRRPERRYPRHVKIKMSNYARNRGKSARAA
jgi:hypothetical protein